MSNSNCIRQIQDDIKQYEPANTLEKNVQYRRVVIAELFSSITTLRCFYHTAKMYPRHNSRRHKCIMNHLAWKSPNRGNMTSNKKCSYFCVGCLSPNSLMLSCEESRRQEGGETLGLECVCVCVEESRDSLRGQDNYSTFSSRRAVTLAHPRSCLQRNRPQQEACWFLRLTACGSFRRTDLFMLTNRKPRRVYTVKSS